MSRPRPGLRPRASRAATPRSGTLFLSELYVMDAISCLAMGYLTAASAGASVRLRRTPGAPDGRAHSRLLPDLYRGRTLVATRRALDGLVRGILRRHDVAHRQANRRWLVAANRRTLLRPARASPERPQRPR